MATHGHGVRAAHGWFGGAEVSSQSPNIMPPSGKSRSAPARPSNASIQAVMLSHWSASSPASPCAWYSVHGTMTAASPQPASTCSGGKPGGVMSGNGTKIGTTPSCSSSCSTARSASQERSMPAVS